MNRTSLTVNRFELVIEDASIASLSEPHEILVSPDDTDFSHGGGASKALWEKGGLELEQVFSEGMPLLTAGETWLSTAGALDARRLLHAMTIDFDEGRAITDEGLEPMIRRILSEADRFGATSIAMPFLGTGAAGVEPERFLHAFATALWEASRFLGPLRRVTLAAMGEDFRRARRSIAARLTGRVRLETVFSEVSRRLAAEGLEDASQELDRMARHLAATPPGALSVILAVMTFVEAVLRCFLVRGIRELRQGLEQPDSVKTNEEHPLALFPELTEVKEPADLPERMTLGGLWRYVRQVYAARGTPFPGAAMNGVLVSTERRNSMAHGILEKDIVIAEELGRILVALEPLFGHLGELLGVPPDSYTFDASELEGRQESRREGPPGITDTLEAERDAFAGDPGPGNRIQQLWSAPSTAQVKQAKVPAPPESAATTRSKIHETDRSGTAHVRRLRDIFQKYADPKDFAELIQELRTYDRCRGETELVLLEGCTKRRDLVAFVRDNLRRSDLRRALHEEFGYQLDPGTPVEQMTTLLLKQLGFPIPTQARGLNDIIGSLVVAQGQAKILSEEKALEGLVLHEAKGLEYVLQVLLRFLCRAVYQTAPDRLFLEDGLLEKRQPLDRCSLGKLVELTVRLAEKLEADAAPSVQRFAKTFNLAPLLAAREEQLPTLRNRFAHFKAGHPQEGLSKTREEAEKFLESALSFLRQLGGADELDRAFPRVIRVTKIEFDQWGRRIIHALDENNELEELFTDDELRPGETYFMHPLSNPLRVDPLLVSAGDLGAGISTAATSAATPHGDVDTPR